jgi:hypothetical protein
MEILSPKITVHKAYDLLELGPSSSVALSTPPNLALLDTIKPFSDFRSRTQPSLSVCDTSNDGK